MPLRPKIAHTVRNIFATTALFTILLALPAYAQFTPSDDAYVNSASPTTNYGAAGTLGVASASQTSYIRFDLTAVPSTYNGTSVAKATLKLFVNGVATAGKAEMAFSPSSTTLPAFPSTGPTQVLERAWPALAARRVVLE